MDFFSPCKRLANRERLNLLRKVMSTPLHEGHGGCDVNGLKAPNPAFAKLLSALSDENRVRVLFEIRKVGQSSKPELLTLCRLAEPELRHHLQALTKAGLVVKNGDLISFVEPVDSHSQLFLSIAFDHVAMAEHSSLTGLCVSAEP